MHKIWPDQNVTCQSFGDPIVSEVNVPVEFIFTMSYEWRKRMIAVQNSMRLRVNRIAERKPIRYVGGCDLTVKGDLMVGCFIVVDIENDCQMIYEKCTIVNVDIPYIPGLLCFREGPVVVQCLQEFRTNRPDLELDVLLVDGSGQWHSRSFGLACYVGVETDIPTIGVSKTFLNTGSRHTGRQVEINSQSVCVNFGDVMMLRHVLEDGIEISCAVMRTTDSIPFQPIFISPGHRMTIEIAIEVVRSVCIFREPEPLRLADRISRTFVKRMKASRKRR
jgi:deoxyinosine 3'endonuclease (endonuclease V)